ncbi:TolC family outer membrane protein [Aliihoeflea sp. 2WW]|uniref:TolC family outer membrane protein n=1 Tax=Aliihoeflea sp. 2WW TaxID=1381123 RepID=UPI0004636B2C|nr:TolC family outer membrane protein [Aliihoeflea sp. 2WW]
MSTFRRFLFSAALASSALIAVAPAHSETILGALAKAYENNASLNSARAGVRVTDETVPIAKSGWRPTVGGSGQINYQTQSGTDIFTGSFGVSIQQSLFDGFQTTNNVRSAEANVRAAQQSLRNTEQNILFNAASAYMDIIRDRQIASLQERNLAFLGEQVRAANSRFEVGEGTRTDVAQADASRAAAIAQLAAARAQVQASGALYRQIVGQDPSNLSAAGPLTNLLPPSLDAAYTLAAAQHPAILATQHLVDAAGFSVKSAEGALLPSVTASAGVSSTYTDRGLPGVTGGMTAGSETTNSANVGINLTIPIYQGGRVSGLVRQSKEQLGQARIEVDVTRDQVRQAVTAAWTQYVAAREVSSANRQLASAAQLALNGVSEERNVGQRTTLDVLNAQADVINAQINLASSERDVVVASYAILSAAGRLTASNLGLAVTIHQPEEHYDAVKDKWYGTRTPDGR